MMIQYLTTSLSRNLSTAGFLLLTLLLPALSNADYDACVVDVNPYLNIRANKYPDSSVIGKLYSRTKVRVNTHGSTGFRKIHVPATGWVSGAYLDRSHSFQNNLGGYAAKVSTSGGNLNARYQPGICFDVIYSLRNGQHLQVITYTTSVPWAMVSFTKSNGQTQYAYVHRRYISKR